MDKSHGHGSHHADGSTKLPLTGLDDEGSDDSEAELGPGWRQYKIKEQRLMNGDGRGRAGAKRSGKKTRQSEKRQVEAMFDAVKHIASTLMERANGMRGGILEEAADMSHVISGINDVVEVLVRRATDL